MTWISVVSLAIQMVAAVVGYLKDRQQIDAGMAEAVAAQLQGALNEIKKAQAVRDAVRQSFDAGRLPADDPNLRD